MQKELSIVKLIYDLKEKGESFQAIVDYLENKGIPTKHEGKWSKSTIYKMLKNIGYKGLI